MAWGSIFGKKPDDKAKASIVEQRWQTSQAAKRALEGEFFTNVAYFRGHQYVVWNNNERRLTIDLIPEWKAQLISNFIMPDIMTILSLMVRREPGFTVVPTSSSARTERAAKAGAAYLKDQWERLNLPKKVQLARLWALVCGRSMLGVFWDPDAGEESDVVVPDDDFANGEGEAENLQTEKRRTGANKVEVFSPFAFHLDPMTVTVNEASWIITQHYSHVRDLVDTYGKETAGKLQGEKGAQPFGAYERKLLYDFGRISYPDVDTKDLVVVRECWERPTQESPEGQYVVSSGMTLLEAKDNAYGDELPFVEFGCYPALGSYWDEALVTQLRPLQTEYNRSRSRHIDAGNLMGNSKWMAWRNSGLIQTAFDSEPGEIIEVSDDAKSLPQRSDPPPVGQHWLQSAEVAARDMDRISGVNDAARGKADTFKSGRALAIAQEGMVSRQSILVNDQQAAMHDLGFKLIRRAKQFFTEDRLIRIVGRDHAPLAFAFGRTDAEMCYDIEVEAISGFPFSRIAKMEFVLEAWEKNLIVNKDGQRDSHKALQLLEFGDLDRLFDDADLLDLRHAEAENDKFQEGDFTDVEVAAWDNHYLHADTIRLLLVSEEGRALRRENSKAWQAAVDHRDLHLQMIGASENPQGAMELSRPPVGAGAAGQSTRPGSLPPGAQGAPQAPQGVVVQPGADLAEQAAGAPLMNLPS